MAETKGDLFRKKIKELKEEEKPIKPKKDEKKKAVPKGPLKGADNMQNFEKSLKNLKEDYRFPKIEKSKLKAPDRGPMQPLTLAKGGRVMYKSGSKGCKLAMKGKGRAYGKNS